MEYYITNELTKNEIVMGSLIHNETSLSKDISIHIITQYLNLDLMCSMCYITDTNDLYVCTICNKTFCCLCKSVYSKYKRCTITNCSYCGYGHCFNITPKKDDDYCANCYAIDFEKEGYTSVSSQKN